MLRMAAGKDALQESPPGWYAYPAGANESAGSLTKEIVQRGLGAGEFSRVFGDVGAWPWFEVVAEIRLILLAHFLRGRLLAVLGIAHVVLDAKFTNVQLGIARLADLEPPQRQTQGSERCSTAPTDEIV